MSALRQRSDSTPAQRMVRLGPTRPTIPPGLVMVSKRALKWFAYAFVMAGASLGLLIARIL